MGQPLRSGLQIRVYISKYSFDWKWPNCEIDSNNMYLIFLQVPAKGDVEN